MKGDMLTSSAGRSHVELEVDPNLVALILRIHESHPNADAIEIAEFLNREYIVSHALESHRACFLRIRESN